MERSWRLCLLTASLLTEPLLGAALVHDLEKTWLEFFDGRNVGGQDTHVTARTGQVYLSHFLRVVDGLSREV